MKSPSAATNVASECRLNWLRRPCSLLQSLLLSMSIMFYVPTSIAATGGETGPKMDEIAKWIKKELPPLGTDHIIKKSAKEGDSPIGDTYTINKAILSDCTLKIEQTDSPDVTAPLGWATTATIPLKNIDLSKLSSGESATWPGYTQNKPSYFVRVVALPEAPPFGTVRVWANTKKEEKTVAKLYVILRDEAPSHRLEGYLRDAATMCGAPVALTAAARQPIVKTPTVQPTSPETAAGSDPKAATASSVSTSGNMTNADVIAMVNAGLSETVIANSIRQAAKRTFDLSPSGLVSLKKAKVPDSLMVAMQSTPIVTAAPPPTATTPSKYDAGLTKKYEAEKAAAVLAATGCTGIEMMGLYKNEVFDRAMGGGITEWLVKIRNNTQVTKIVVFGWRDQYGQEQRSQVQIRGGEIASPRLDLTQARYIAPTTDMRLVSCQ